jgi:hypothetical protein
MPAGGAAAPDTVAEAALLQAFERQIGWCEQPSPFSARVLRRTRLWLTEQPEALQTLAAVAEDPLAGAVALRWLSGLHHLALLGQAPWQALWMAGACTPSDAELDAAINLAWQERRAHLQRALAGPPQTNEVQRSAALLAGLFHIAAQTQRPLALAEIGSSAGLNLWCDQHRYEAIDASAAPVWTWGDPKAALRLTVEWSGGPPPAAELIVTQRAGCDAAPVDLQRPGEDLRLASFIWPDQSERLARLRAATAVARSCMAQHGVRVQHQRAADFVRGQLASRPEGAAWVLMHSVVWQYIPAQEQAEIVSAVHAAAQTATAAAPLAWLRFEPPRADLRMELRCQIWPGGEDTLLAMCHPHGNRVEWQTAA